MQQKDLERCSLIHEQITNNFFLYFNIEPQIQKYAYAN